MRAIAALIAAFLVSQEGNVPRSVAVFPIEEQLVRGIVLPESKGFAFCGWRVSCDLINESSLVSFLPVSGNHIVDASRDIGENVWRDSWSFRQPSRDDLGQHNGFSWEQDKAGHFYWSLISQSVTCFFHGLYFCLPIIFSEKLEDSQTDIEGWSFPCVGKCDLRVQFSEADVLKSFRSDFNFDRNPRPLLSLHFVQLRLHGALSQEQDDGGSSRYTYRDSIKHEAPPIPIGLAIPLGLLLCGTYGVVIAYALKRGDYWMPVLLIGAWPAFALGFCLLVYRACPPFFEGVYEALPVCRYNP